MNKRTIIVVLIAVCFLGVFPAAVQAGWKQDGFTPSITKLVNDNQEIKYLVKPGDTVWDIAADTGSDAEVILAMNNLTVNSFILEGQYLKVPWVRNDFHRVKAGDTMWEIASAYQVDLNQLISINDKRKNPSSLTIGEVLIIPSSGGSKEISQPSRGMAGMFSWPVFGQISSSFGRRKDSFHHGLDIACPMNTPIRAAKSGEVIFTGKKAIYGRMVVIEHSQGVETLYAHASKVMVTKGQKVKRGQVIALVGVSGRTTGPHLHFQVNRNGKAVNPISFLR